MKRARAISLMALIAAIPAATAGSFFASNTAPCFADGNFAYRLSGSARADVVVRIDNAAAHPSLRMEIVDDPAAADFVLMDDGDNANACASSATVRTVGLDPAAANPDLTVALTPGSGDYKIYVRSQIFTAQDAAALFAVMWQNARRAATGRTLAARN